VSRRAFVVVADACGAGELPDAGDYGDSGSNTLGHLAQAVGGLHLPVLGRLGLGCILPLEGVPPTAAPALHGRLAAQGYGKDSTSGHWEPSARSATCSRARASTRCIPARRTPAR
jgi:phosphopentomutase